MALDINGLPINDRGEVWSGGQMVGMMPGMGGGDVGVGREQIAQAMLAQQGMPPPQQGPRIDFGGLNPMGGPQPGPQPGPRGGGGGRQQVGGGWSTEGNNVYDPSGGLVGSQGLQQYGYIPGVSPQGARAGLGLDNPYTGGSSLSGGLIGMGSAGNVFGSSPYGEGDLSQGGQGRTAYGGTMVSPENAPAGSIPGSGAILSDPGIFAAGGAQHAVSTQAQAPTTTFAQAAPNAPPAEIDIGRNIPGAWDPQTGAPLTPAATQYGPNPNAPGNVAQAGTTGQPGGYGAPGGFTGFGGFSGGFGGGWGGGGFEGSGFNSSGDYSGGYDTAAGTVG